MLAAVIVAGPRADSPASFPEIPRAFAPSLTAVPGAPAVRPEDDLRAMTRRMLLSTETVWRRTFARAGLPAYRRAAFGGFVEDREARPCADRDEDLVGLYCPDDQRIFLRRGDYERVGPDVWAYVIAHEVGHHVQQLRGTIPAVDERTSDRPIDADELTALVEAQADCYAGVWAKATRAGEDLVFAASHPRWFRRGRDEGRPGACHTFAGD